MYRAPNPKLARVSPRLDGMGNQSWTSLRVAGVPVAGLVVAALSVTVTTLIVYPLAQVAPEVSLGVVYLLAVLLVATVWGLWLGVVTSVASALAFNFFHIPPTGGFTISDGEHWVALSVFFVTAIVASELAERARQQAREADERRGEADLSAEMARLLLRADDLREALAAGAHRIATALDLPSASIEVGSVDAGERRVAFPLREGARQIGTLLVPASLPESRLRRLQERVVPSLEALLAAALERDQLLSNRVEAAALRRTDVLKTALLRAVSHDLRSPLTAILNAAGPLKSGSITPEERTELVSVITQEAQRLSQLIDNLLDLSRLEAGAAEPQREWCDLREVIEAAVDELQLPDETFRLQLSSELPLIKADASQLQRAFVNLFGNSARHSGGHPVQIRASALHNRIMVRVVDRGPGIPPAQQERVFEPFYRAGTDRTGHRGSGLGLAIVRGFVEANGGRVWVESLPHQGTTFALELPLDQPTDAAPADAPTRAGSRT
jgi:two-component system sensor histidine kinase KdpD